MTRWHYNGDVNLKYGGFFWREDGSDDYVLCVRVTPCSNAGGPDNLYHVETGSIYMPQDRKKANSALSCLGWSIDEKGAVTLGRDGQIVTGRAARACLVDAWLAYHGTERDAEYVIRVGRRDLDARGWCADEEPDYVLRSNAKLRNFIKREFLS